VCGRHLGAGLRGFELYASCLDCCSSEEQQQAGEKEEEEGFDVCFDCCALSTLHPPTSSSRLPYSTGARAVDENKSKKKKEKKQKNAGAAETIACASYSDPASATPGGEEAVAAAVRAGLAQLTVKGHSNGTHRFRLVDRSRDDDDDDDDKGCQGDLGYHKDGKICMGGGGVKKLARNEGLGCIAEESGQDTPVEKRGAVKVISSESNFDEHNRMQDMSGNETDEDDDDDDDDDDSELDSDDEGDVDKDSKELATLVHSGGGGDPHQGFKSVSATPHASLTMSLSPSSPSSSFPKPSAVSPLELLQRLAHATSSTFTTTSPGAGLFLHGVPSLTTPPHKLSWLAADPHPAATKNNGTSYSITDAAAAAVSNDKHPTSADIEHEKDMAAAFGFNTLGDAATALEEGLQESDAAGGARTTVSATLVAVSEKDEQAPTLLFAAVVTIAPAPDGGTSLSGQPTPRKHLLFLSLLSCTYLSFSIYTPPPPPAPLKHTTPSSPHDHHRSMAGPRPTCTSDRFTLPDSPSRTSQKSSPNRWTDHNGGVPHDGDDNGDERHPAAVRHPSRGAYAVKPKVASPLSQSGCPCGWPVRTCTAPS
jgi:hypothetical protein